MVDSALYPMEMGFVFGFHLEKQDFGLIRFPARMPLVRVLSQHKPLIVHPLFLLKTKVSCKQACAII